MALKDQLEDMSALQDEYCSQTSALSSLMCFLLVFFSFLGHAW